MALDMFFDNWMNEPYERRQGNAVWILSYAYYLLGRPYEGLRWYSVVTWSAEISEGEKEIVVVQYMSL